MSPSQQIGKVPVQLCRNDARERHISTVRLDGNQRTPEQRMRPDAVGNQYLELLVLQSMTMGKIMGTVMGPLLCMNRRGAS